MEGWGFLAAVCHLVPTRLTWWDEGGVEDGWVSAGWLDPCLVHMHPPKTSVVPSGCALNLLILFSLLDHESAECHCYMWRKS